MEIQAGLLPAAVRNAAVAVNGPAGPGADERGLDRAGRRFDIPVHEAPDDHDRDDDRDPQRRAATMTATRSGGP